MDPRKNIGEKLVSRAALFREYQEFRAEITKLISARPREESGEDSYGCRVTINKVAIAAHDRLYHTMCGEARKKARRIALNYCPPHLRADATFRQDVML